jgi:hypothetical protein
MQGATKIKWLLFAIVLFVVAGCASNKPQISINDEQNFDAINSFYVKPPENTTSATITNYMVSSISTLLMQKGLTPVDSADADVTVLFYPSTALKEDGKSISFGLGTGAFGRSGGISLGSIFNVPVGEQVSQYQSLQIDIVKDGSFVYSAVGSTEIDAKDSITIQKKLSSLVSSLLEPYPGKSNLAQ